MSTTPLGEAVLQDRGMIVKVEGYFGQKRGERHGDGDDSETGKDRSKINGWRPMVLANTVEKWGENSPVYP